MRVIVKLAAFKKGVFLIFTELTRYIGVGIAIFKVCVINVCKEIIIDRVIFEGFKKFLR